MAHPTTSAPPAPGVRAHFAELAAAMEDARQARDRAAEEYAKHAPAAEQLASLVNQHQAELQRMLSNASDLSAYGDHLFAANRLAQEIDALRREIDMDEYRAAAKRVDDANKVLAELGERFREVHLLAAVEAAGRYLRSVYAPAAAEMIQRRNVIHELAACLEAIGHAQSLLPAVSAAGTIRRMIGELNGSIRVVPNAAEPVGEFLQRLETDPAAELRPPPSDPVFTLEPRHVPDGVDHFNRAAAE
jgi:hypothetical protein